MSPYSRMSAHVIEPWQYPEDGGGRLVLPGVLDGRPCQSSNSPTKDAHDTVGTITNHGDAGPCPESGARIPRRIGIHFFVRMISR